MIRSECMSDLSGYLGQFYVPLATPGGTPILVITQGTRLAGWVELIEANGEANALWYIHNDKGEAMWCLMRRAQPNIVVDQLSDGYRFVWAVAGWVDLRNSVRRMHGSASAATYPQRLIGNESYMMQPDFRVTPEMMSELLEEWDGAFTVAPY